MDTVNNMLTGWGYLFVGLLILCASIFAYYVVGFVVIGGLFISMTSRTIARFVSFVCSIAFVIFAYKYAHSFGLWTSIIPALFCYLGTCKMTEDVDDPRNFHQVRSRRKR